MHIELSKSAIEWQKKAREYADEYLQPYEIQAELNDGKLPANIVNRQKRRRIKFCILF